MYKNNSPIHEDYPSFHGNFSIFCIQMSLIGKIMYDKVKLQSVRKYTFGGT